MWCVAVCLVQMMQVPFNANAAHTALVIANLMLTAYRRTKTPRRDAKQTRETNGLLTDLFCSSRHVVSTWLMCGQIFQLAFFVGVLRSEDRRCLY